MPTNTIGTAARDYSTLQAWENAVPATPTGGYTGECYNDSEFTVGVEIGGHTTSAVNFIRLTAANANSFQDDAGVRTNALIYDQSKGVGINANDFAASVVYVNNDYVTVDRLQMKRSGNSYTKGTLEFGSGTANSKVFCCIVGKTFGSASNIAYLDAATAINTLFYNTHATVGNGISFQGGGTALNCTVVNGAATGGNAVTTAYGTSATTNCLMFGFTALVTGSGLTGDYNASDLTGLPGSNSLNSQTYANQFVSTTNDWRIKSGATVINVGLTNVLAPNDITNTARGVTNCTMGCWEFVSASGVTITPLVGSLTLTGVAPNRTTDFSRIPLVGALVLAGLAAGVTQQANRVPQVGSLTLAGSAPNVAASGSYVVAPSTGSMTFTGEQPVQDLTISAPGTGSLTLTGVAPAVTQQLTIRPTAGSLVFTGYAADLGLPVLIQPSAGSLTLTGAAPLLSGSVTIAPAVGSLTFTGAAPLVQGDRTLTPVTGSLTFTSNAPAITIPVSITPLVGSLVFTGYESLRLGFIQPGTGSLVFTGYAPASSGGGITGGGTVEGTSVEGSSVTGRSVEG